MLAIGFNKNSVGADRPAALAGCVSGTIGDRDVDD
jgi:hypothetical protein